MRKLGRLLFPLATLALWLPALSWAGPILPYSAERFDALTGTGKPVVVAVHASWCPTCKAQQPIQSELMKSDPFKNYTMLVVDFDTDHDALQRFHVVKQSTMIVFKGKTEVGRSIGDTQPESMKALMLKAST